MSNHQLTFFSPSSHPSLYMLLLLPKDFLIHPFSIFHGMNIFVFCLTCSICCMLHHFYISITTQLCCLKFIILIHISHKKCSLMHGLSVYPGFFGSLDKTYTDRSRQLSSGTIYGQHDAGLSTTSA